MSQPLAPNRIDSDMLALILLVDDAISGRVVEQLVYASLAGYAQLYCTRRTADLLIRFGTETSTDRGERPDQAWRADELMQDLVAEFQIVESSELDETLWQIAKRVSATQRVYILTEQTYDGPPLNAGGNRAFENLEFVHPDAFVDRQIRDAGLLDYVCTSADWPELDGVGWDTRRRGGPPPAGNPPDPFGGSLQRILSRFSNQEATARDG